MFYLLSFFLYYTINGFLGRQQLQVTTQHFLFSTLTSNVYTFQEFEKMDEK